ncbi:MAG: hypothetical protein AAGA48_39080 [Myxococcota bacterium]
MVVLWFVGCAAFSVVGNWELTPTTWPVLLPKVLEAQVQVEEGTLFVERGGEAFATIEFSAPDATAGLEGRAGASVIDLTGIYDDGTLVQNDAALGGSCQLNVDEFTCVGSMTVDGAEPEIYDVSTVWVRVD